MKRPLTFDRLRVQNVARCRECFYPVESRSATDWACALAEETGEVARICVRLRNGKLTRAQARALLAGELADVVTYVDLLADRCGIDLDDAVREKFAEVSRRVASPRRL
jgi:NTP pyrophosphatase (non-canonical NTP hydrolase)